MWKNRTRLPHVLPTEAYYAPAHHARELAAIFRPGWHCVGSIDDVPAHGDCLNAELFGSPISLRNDHGRIAAFANIYAHRYTPVPCRTERLGKLVFISLVDDTPGLRQQLGERSYLLGERLFPTEARQIVARQLEHPCNWKIPLENVLESYHVPVLHGNPLARHPALFKVFTGKRGGNQQLVHELDDRYSAYFDSLGGDSRLYGALIAALRPGATCDYVHHHAFPNIVFGHTSIVSFLQVVVPTSPTTSRSLIRLFLHLDERAAHRRVVIRLIAPLLGRVAARLIEMVLREDAAIYPAVQQGITRSVHSGVLGSREERVHAFQTYVARALDQSGAGVPARHA